MHANLCKARSALIASSCAPENTIVVLITGASGFIGRRVAQELLRSGHEVACITRRPAGASDDGACGRSIAGDFTRDHDVAVWVPRLQGIDAVVNAVGILRERGGQTFDALHVKAPCALFDACVRAGVRRVVQISALGADDDAASQYHLSKKAADDHLLRLPLSAVVVQPSLVYGAGGASAKLFTTLASLPFIPVPGSGEQRVQPVHIDDAVEAIAALVTRDVHTGEHVPIVGPRALSLREFLAALRGALGLKPARVWRVPMPWVRTAASAVAFLPGALLDKPALQMLERGNTGSAEAMRDLLGRAPRDARAFIAPSEAAGVRAQALLGWLLPLARLSVAAVWIWTGIVSFGVYPVQESYALLARVGAGPALAPWLLYGAAALDLALGIGTLVLKRRRWLWIAQIALMLGYTAIITLRLPEFWLHPYGPILKNLPMLALLALLLAFDAGDRKSG